MNIKKSLAALVLTAGAGLASVASAATVHIGTTGASNAWGIVNFTHSGGALTIDALANGFTGGPTGTGIDDIFLTLLVDNGSALTAFTGALVTQNDDSGQTFGDGSSTALDSFLDAGNLAAGDYLLTISHCCTSFDSVRNIGLNSGIHAPFLDYQLTFSQNVVIGNAVPEPASLGLMLAGLGLLGARRRRKSAVN